MTILQEACSMLRRLWGGVFENMTKFPLPLSSRLPHEIDEHSRTEITRLESIPSASFATNEANREGNSRPLKRKRGQLEPDTPTFKTADALESLPRNIAAFLQPSPTDSIEVLPHINGHYWRNQVTPTGQLPGGLEYRLKTFTILGHGDKLYMLATDVSRLTGYRDSYLLFLRNKKLHKVVPTRTERDDLVRREIIPFSNRYRPIGVVSARSVFKQFGQRVIIDRETSPEYYDETRVGLQGRVLPSIITKVQPKSTVAIMDRTNQNMSMSSGSNRIVESQVPNFPQWKTILPCPTSPKKVIQESVPSDQVVERTATDEVAPPNRVDNVVKSQALPSIRELFGNLQGPRTSSLRIINNHLNLSTRYPDGWGWR